VLHIHRAERADRLVEALSDLLAVPLEDPMAAEVVAVPTRGVERWLSQRLAARLGALPGRSDGVCANVDFPFPGRLVGGAIAAATGVDRDGDPWLPERLVWPLLDVVDASLGEPWLAPLAAHLGVGDADPDAARANRRFGSVRHIADLYDRYGVHRPGMLRAWAAGEDTDGAGRPLPADAAWQAPLWRRLRERLGLPSPAERLDGACAALRAGATPLDLPARLSLFGLTRLPASYLEVLAALAEERHVHLFLLHPSPALWERVDGAVEVGSGVMRRADDPTAALPRNPLLASWGRDAREMQIVLHAAGAQPADDHRPLDAAPTTLLQRIQADIREDRAPPGAPLPDRQDLRAPLDPDDRSLQVHACHGRARQVEVLRDAILHLLAEDPTLEPRDVIVMCPDIETFAPLIQATFAAGEEDEEAGDPTARRAVDLRVRLADRSLRQTNPVLGVVGELIDLASARLTAAQVLDFAGREPVRRRFHLDDDDLSRLEDWAAATGVRWGLDAAGRAPFKLEQLEANTWRAGLDRILLGAVMDEEGQRLVGGTLPLDDVDSGAIDLAGRVAELVDRLQAALDGLRSGQPLANWVAAIATGAAALTATTEWEAWQRSQLERLLDDVLAEGTVAGRASDAHLELAEIRALLADRLRGRPTRANFRTGHLTICTLVPMRSVPHRVVCLLGLDDGVFPRKTALDGDDIALADPHVGDRDPRSEDRQLLLDALLAATDRLVITYAGRDERTNAERPPAVPVGELLDVVDRTARVDRGSARDLIVVHHPLQPFDPRNFTPGAIVPPRAWSFDHIALAGARALAGERPPLPPFLPAPLPRLGAPAVELDQLVRFVQHPVKAFLRQRLGVSVSDYADELREGLPVELDGLERWGVGHRLLEGRLAGVDAAACRAAELARGQLPPGELGRPVLDEVAAVVELLVRQAGALAGADAEWGSTEVNLRLPDGRLLVGTVPGISGDLLREVTFSSLAPKHRLTAWVRFLALSAAHPGRGFRAATVGRRRRAAPRECEATIARLRPLDGETAMAHLTALADLYERGMREPLPIYCATSAAYVTAAKKRESAAAKAWESDRFPQEDVEPEHTLVLGGQRPFTDLLVPRPAADERGDGWDESEPTRFGRLARRLWSGLLAHEELEDR